MDPYIEQLHAHRPAHAGGRPSRRESAVQGAAAALLLVVCAALPLIAGGNQHAAIGESVALVALYALVQHVQFKVGIGSTTPLQLIVVPMWFVAAPCYLPLLVVL